MTRILAGVNATEGATIALHWAAAECRLRDGELWLVHVAPAQVDLSPSRNDERARGIQQASSMWLDDLAVTARGAHPDIAVETLLGRGEAADTLINLSALAELVVLGTTGLGGNPMSMIGSVSSRVAAQAHCPVVIVPGQPAARAAEPTIVVGTADTPAGELALHFAFDEARRRRASVTAVQAQDAGEKSAQAALQARLAAIQAEYAGVPATASLRLGYPAEVILEAARDAELVVLGAHHSDNRWSTRLGPVPQTVLHHTNCPVVLVGTPQHRVSWERALRRARLHSE